MLAALAWKDAAAAIKTAPNATPAARIRPPDALTLTRTSPTLAPDRRKTHAPASPERAYHSFAPGRQIDHNFNVGQVPANAGELRDPLLTSVCDSRGHVLLTRQGASGGGPWRWRRAGLGQSIRSLASRRPAACWSKRCRLGSRIWA